MRYDRHKYTGTPADTVPRWAVGRLNGTRTVFGLWTPWAFHTLAVGRLIGPRHRSIIVTPQGVIR